MSRPDHAYSFCEVEERAYLVDIERLIRLHIPKAVDHPYVSKLGPPPVTDLSPRSRNNNQPRRSSPPQNNGRNNQRRPGRSYGSSNGPRRSASLREGERRY